MKLLTVKKRKIAVLFTGGLGDTLLYTPLLKELKKKQFVITGIFYSKYDNDCLLDESLVDKKVYCNTKIGLLLYSIFRLKHFTNTYINHLAFGKAIQLAASICSRKITKSAVDISTPTKKRIKNIVPGFSDAEENLYFLYSKENAAIKNITSFHLPKPILDKELIKKYIDKDLSQSFILQISAGNNTTPFKNWPIKNWLKLTETLCTHYPKINFIIVGDNTETGYSNAFENLPFKNCTTLIGKTTIPEIFNLVAFSNGYIGLDSGIMHIATALGKKTLTIFGASNEKLYGYEFLDAAAHKVISTSISCRPCSSWKNANISRVTNPMLCPDFACLTSIEPLFVFEQIVVHFNL